MQNIHHHESTPRRHLAARLPAQPERKLTVDAHAPAAGGLTPDEIRQIVRDILG